MVRSKQGAPFLIYNLCSNNAYFLTANSPIPDR